MIEQDYKIITSYTSNSGSSKEIHTIYGEPKSGSLADYILLKEYYKNNDVDYILENVGWKIKLFHHWNFLIRRMHQCNGNLICVYCGKQNLIIQAVGRHVPKNIMATVDHFNPKAKGGEHYDEDNMVVSCSKCNGKKSDKIWSVDTLKYMDDKRKQIFIRKYG